MSEAPAADETTTRKRGLARPFLAGTLVVITSLSIVGALVTTWAHRTVFKTDEWLSVVGPLPKDPDVANALAQFAVTQLGTVIDLRANIQQALPPELAPFTDVVLDRLRPRIEARIAAFIQSDPFNQVWVEVNRRAHDAIVRILRGESTILVTGPNGEVRLNLVPLVYQALTFIQDHASFALRGHTVPVGVDPVNDPQAAVEALAAEFGRPLPSDFAQPVVFTSQRLAAAQQAVHAFDVVWVMALLLPLVLIAVAIITTKRRRRRTLQLAVGALLAVLLAQVAIRRIQESVVDSVKQPGNRRAVGDVAGAVTHGLNTLFLVCVIAAVLVGIVAYFMGRPAWSVRLLAAGRRAMNSDRGVAGQVAIARHASECVWGGVAVAVIILWFVGLSWLSAAILGLLVVAWVALIESVRRRHPAPKAEASTAPETAGDPA